MSFDLIRLLAFQPRLSLVHSHALGRVGAIGRTIARRRGVPFIVTVHGGVYDLPPELRRSLSAPNLGGWEWGKPFGMMLRSRQLLSDADAIVTCNRREADLIRERHPQQYVYIQRHGVPAARFQADHRAAAVAAFPAIAGRPFLLSIGRIDPVKNPGWLVEQMPALLQRHPGTVLVLAGSCTDEVYGTALGNQIRRMGLEQQVLLIGKLPPQDPRLIGLLQQARAMVLPSLSETFGIVILEAWAAGAPVIASRTTGATALIESGETGWLFGLESPEGFHQGIDAVLDQPSIRTRWIGAGRRRVEEEFDCDALAGQMKQLYEYTQEAKHAHRRITG
jgi:glycosyltransferase involved in cell wall biosynthesis